MQTEKYRITAREVLDNYIREKLDEEIRGMWSIVVFYRWLSILLTPLFIRTSVTATQVTLLALLLTLSQPLSLLMGSPASYLYLVLIGILFNVLDCVDGDIARVTGTCSEAGRYYDSQADVVHRIVTYLSVGLLFQHLAGENMLLTRHALLLTSVACLLSISARLSRYYFENNFSRPVSRPARDAEKSWFARLENFVFSFISGLDHCLPFFILLAALFDKHGWLIAWLLIYSIMDFIYTQYRNCVDLQ